MVVALRVATVVEQPLARTVQCKAGPPGSPRQTPEDVVHRKFPPGTGLLQNTKQFVTYRYTTELSEASFMYNRCSLAAHRHHGWHGARSDPTHVQKPSAELVRP